jgi:pyruvate formate-lyase activating enzyme-like uncharacterized protein
MVRLIKQKKIFSGRLATGCTFCMKGRKSVLFITSRCHYECFYCPISDDKRKEDVMKINETRILHPESEDAFTKVCDEIRLCQSTGVGITGGDPLATPQRTYYYIKALKKEFGKSFHIHLYTSPQLVSKEKLLHVTSVGLDEIRFHLNVEDDSLWKRILFANTLSLKVGVEIPAIPGTLVQSKKLLDFCKTHKIEFVNINELEYSDVGDAPLHTKGFVVKNSVSYGIRSSEELAKELVAYGKKIGLRVHYCSASWKDAVQLGNRFLLRSQKVAQPFDVVDAEGLLTRGEIRLMNQSNFSLTQILDMILEEFELQTTDYCLATDRILFNADVLEQLWPQLASHNDLPWLIDVQAAIVTEYPTSDNFIVEKTIL